MIKVTDLMIGDYVTFADCIKNPPLILIKIEALGYQDGEGENSSLVRIDNEKACDIIDIDDEIVGIPLTPEILKKNGFSSYNNSSFQLRDNGMYISWRNIGRLNISYGCSPITSVHIKCKYVHQLQHALKLCGINKSIKLCTKS